MRFTLYYRCSTSKQDYSIEAQRQQVFNYLRSLGTPYDIVSEYSEIDSGRNQLRPRLLEALAVAKASKSTLCVSRLDRLSRSALQVLTLIQQGKVPVVFCDAPSADFLTIGVMALLSEREATLISARTKEGMAVARQKLLLQGRRLGNPTPAASIKRAHIVIQARKQSFNDSILKVIREIRETGIGNNYARISDCLTKRGEKGRRGGAWTATSVRRLMKDQVTAGA